MRLKRSKPRAYAFIDSQNLNLGVQKVGWKMDWRKFRAFLKDEYGVVNAYMFIGYMQEHEDIYEYMHSLGFLVVLKPTVDTSLFKNNEAGSSRLDDMQGEGEERSKSYSKYDARAPQNSTQQIAKSTSRVIGSADEQASTSRTTKGNVDADLVLYAMKEFPNYDKAIIVSGDGDFYGLIEYLQKKKKLGKVLTPNWQYSSLLKPFENSIVRLDQKKRQLSYFDRKKK